MGGVGVGGGGRSSLETGESVTVGVPSRERGYEWRLNYIHHGAIFSICLLFNLSSYLILK